MNKRSKNLKGFSLVELILAIAVFTAMISSLTYLVIDTTRTLENINTRNNATRVTEEIYTALILLKEDAWYNIARYTKEGSKHLEFVSGKYEIVDGEEVKDGITYSFSIEPVMRDSLRNIVLEGGTIDPHSRLINIVINWEDRFGKIYTLNPKIYVNDWNTNSISYTTKEDFDSGTFSDTKSDVIEDGEVRLLSMKYADWCNPSLSMSAFDLPQQGIAKTISTHGEKIYMGTGENSSGISFMDATVVGEPPVVTNGLDTFDGYKTNDVFGLDGYALLATDTNDKEVLIININEVPYTEVGHFNSSGSQDATAVFAVGNIGFVSHANNLTLFDLSSKIGSRPQIRTISVGGSSLITDIYADENYVYLAVTNNPDGFGFFIYSYTPTLQLVGRSNFGNTLATSLFISEDKNRAYIGTKSNSGNEFFILDISNKNTTYPIIAAYELGSLSVSSVVAVDNRAIIGGTGGEEYVVLNLEDEDIPIKCGGLNIDTGINAISLARQGLNVYTYILTGDANKELKIIRGGPGGGGPDGEGYLAYGEYLSEIFDTHSETSTFYILSLKTLIPSQTSLKVQLRTSNDSNMSGSIWLGPDGTPSTVFSATDIYDLPSIFTGRYLQYKAVFQSDTVSTPLLQELIFNYEK